MSDPGVYTVGWICAIEIEYTAAQTFLDNEREPPNRLSTRDTNHYTLGDVVGHNVVMAVLPDGEYGTSSAASVITNMLNSFPNITIGLMVGIGGGAPTRRDHIRLGDIVVSSPKNGSAGVYQYDYGKTIQGSEFVQTGFLNQPPTVVRSAVTGLKSKYRRRGHRIEETIESILETWPRLQKDFSRPPPESDRLYASSFVHSSRRACDESCALRPDNIFKRPPRQANHDNPYVHHGIIASGNQLMKDALIRDRYARDQGVLCFEMEAAGMMNHFPCLVIRGICDYSDSHKNKRWQGYAAMAAAAYAKDLLREIHRTTPQHPKSTSNLNVGRDSEVISPSQTHTVASGSSKHDSMPSQSSNSVPSRGSLFATAVGESSGCWTPKTIREENSDGGPVDHSSPKKATSTLDLDSMTRWELEAVREACRDSSQTFVPTRQSPGLPRTSLSVPQDLASLSSYHIQPSNEKMDQVARDWFTRLHDTVLEVAPQDTAGDWIKIAVLETGVSEGTCSRWEDDRKIWERAHYLSFIDGPPRDDADHGTHAAGILLRTAPNAEVYIARVAIGPNIDAVDPITNAIRFLTIVEEVDIIIIPFAFRQFEPNLEELSKALLDAHEEGIVLFAAGHDSGSGGKVSFPADQDHVICIGACDGLNNPSRFNPPPVYNMFCTLGENITTPYQTPGSPSKSGTSYATSIAAGMAAVLMDWMIYESRAWSEEERRLAQKVRTKKGIINIFQQRLSEQRGAYRILTPWNLFNKQSIGYAKGVLLDILMNT